jgi:magnesium transporter
MRILAWEDGAWTPREGLSRDEARALALGPIPVWVRAEGEGPHVWDQLGDWFDLHPLALEDIQSERQRPKVEDYPEFTFAITRIPRLESEELTWSMVGVFLGEGFVVSACPQKVEEFDEAERRFMAGDWRGRDGGLDMVFYHVLDVIIDSWFPLMDELEERLDDLSDEVLDKADKALLRRVRDIKELASRTRRVLAPTRDAMMSLERAEHPYVRAETRLYLRDVADHTVRLAERLDHVRETALIAQETWNATLANQQNETMKRLTVVAALLLFPALLAGIGGMNFAGGFPSWDFWAVTTGILAFVVVGLLVAVWRKWL